jgi:hypothetical protein
VLAGALRAPGARRWGGGVAPRPHAGREGVSSRRLVDALRTERPPTRVVVPPARQHAPLPRHGRRAAGVRRAYVVPIVIVRDMRGTSGPREAAGALPAHRDRALAQVEADGAFQRVVQQRGRLLLLLLRRLALALGVGCGRARRSHSKLAGAPVRRAGAPEAPSRRPPRSPSPAPESWLSSFGCPHLPDISSCRFTAFSDSDSVVSIMMAMMRLRISPSSIAMAADHAARERDTERVWLDGLVMKRSGHVQTNGVRGARVVGAWRTGDCSTARAGGGGVACCRALRRNPPERGWMPSIQATWSAPPRPQAASERPEAIQTAP